MFTCKKLIKSFSLYVCWFDGSLVRLAMQPNKFHFYFNCWNKTKNACLFSENCSVVFDIDTIWFDFSFSQCNQINVIDSVYAMSVANNIRPLEDLKLNKCVERPTYGLLFTPKTSVPRIFLIEFTYTLEFGLKTRQKSSITQKSYGKPSI